MKITKSKGDSTISFSELKRGSCFRFVDRNQHLFAIKTQANEYLYFAEGNASPVFISNVIAPSIWKVVPCCIEEIILKK